MPKNLYRRGSTWYGRYFIRGEIQRVSLRTSDPREAARRLKALRLKAERHAFGIHEAATWDDAVIAYAAGVLDSEGVKATTAKRYRVSLRQLDPVFRGVPLPAVTTAKIAAYVADRQAAGATNATIRRDLTTMSRVLAGARTRNLIDANPADAFDRTMIRERRAPIAAPDDDAIAAAVAGAEAAGRPDVARVIRFLRANGTRAGEALRARWEHIGPGPTLTIHETKSGRVRTIDLIGDSLPPPTPKEVGRVFADLPEEAGALASVWQWVRRNMPKAQQFRLHDLRHAYAIAEIRSGRDIYDLSHHLGHSSVKVTEIYLGYVAGGRSKSRGDQTQNLTQGLPEKTQKPL